MKTCLEHKIASCVQLCLRYTLFQRNRGFCHTLNHSPPLVQDLYYRESAAEPSTSLMFYHKSITPYFLAFEHKGLHEESEFAGFKKSWTSFRLLWTDLSTYIHPWPLPFNYILPYFLSPLSYSLLTQQILAYESVQYHTERGALNGCAHSLLTVNVT